MKNIKTRCYFIKTNYAIKNLIIDYLLIKLILNLINTKRQNKNLRKL